MAYGPERGQRRGGVGDTKEMAHGAELCGGEGRGGEQLGVWV